MGREGEGVKVGCDTMVEMGWDGIRDEMGWGAEL